MKNNSLLAVLEQNLSSSLW